jgi:hypothetical protein
VVVLDLVEFTTEEVLFVFEEFELEVVFVVLVRLGVMLV